MMDNDPRRAPARREDAPASREAPSAPSAIVSERRPGELVLDGQHGEGGGQILRSGLALCAARGDVAVRVRRIRKNRQPPGLRPQHRQAVLALAQLCDAAVEGVEVGSSALRFAPRRPVPIGDYRFDIGTAGSAPLLLHALFPALCLAAPPGGDAPPRAASQLWLSGGTHLPHAPGGGYLTRVWAPAVRRCGGEVEVTVSRPGFYPQGGGALHARIGAQRPTGGVHWLTRPQPAPRARAQVVLARLPRAIGERMLAQVARRLDAAGLPFDPARDGVIDEARDARSTGVALELFVDEAPEEGPVPAGFLSLGERGLPSEAVADRGVDALLAHLATGAPVDPHLADQLAILLALAPRASRYRTSAITQHLLTHAELLSALWPVTVTVHGDLGEAGEVTVTPRAPRDDGDPAAASAASIASSVD